MESRKLKRMLELKRRIEQARQGDMVIARDEVDRAELSVLTAQTEQHARVAALAAESEVSVGELMERARFVELAGRQLSQARDVLSERHGELAQREEDMVLAARDVRTFEILNERDRVQQRAIARNAEQRATDDIVSARRSKT